MGAQRSESEELMIACVLRVCARRGTLKFGLGTLALFGNT